MKNFKPMLICNEEIDLEKIKYPMLMSTKLDGIRCIFKEGKMLSRSFKPIPNKQLQEKFQSLKDFTKFNKIILDGEIYGIGLTFQEITHYCMTEDLNDIKNIKKVGKKESIPESLKFFCFDCIIDNNSSQEFISRYNYLKSMSHLLQNTFIVEQIEVNNAKEVLEQFEKVLEKGYEGLVLKSALSHYKYGRTTFNENSAYKVKPYKTFDAKIIEIEERFENTSESFKNELGKSQKHSYKDAMIPTGIAGAFIVDYEGQKQKVVLSGPEDFRRGVWINRTFYIGKWIEYKGMLIGSKDKVRHPVFLRMRHDLK